MRYSYILEGYDVEWQDTWERQVRYENLPVGEYTFKVTAINR
ncbi:MAG: triple tyrosine motif-containing protein, partial [Promethearchaeota archaeon]